MRISIALVVTGFTGGPDLSRALTSAIEQATPFTAVIAVNANPSNPRVGDAIQSALKSSQASCHLTVVESDRSLGPSDALNLGWRHADTDYVAFLDEDDWLESDAAEQVWKGIGLGGQDWYSTRYRTSSGESMPALDERLQGPFYADEANSLFLEHLSLSHLKVIARRALENSGGFDHSFDGCQDWELLQRLALSGKWARIDADVYNHSVHPSQLSARQRADVLRKVNVKRRQVLGPPLECASSIRTQIETATKEIGATVRGGRLADLMLISGHADRRSAARFSLPLLVTLLRNRDCDWVILAGERQPELGMLWALRGNLRHERRTVVSIAILPEWLPAAHWAIWYAAYVDLVVADATAESLVSYEIGDVTPIARIEVPSEAA